MSYTLTGLLAYTEYQFSVRAATVENDVGLWGNFSNMAVTRTEAAGTWSIVLYEFRWLVCSFYFAKVLVSKNLTHVFYDFIMK